MCSLWCGSVDDLAAWSSPASTSTPPCFDVPAALACLNTSPQRSTPGPLPYHMPNTPSYLRAGSAFTCCEPQTAVAASSSFTPGWKRWKLPSPTWPTIGAIRPSRRCPSASRHAIGQPRDRHADVGGERRASRACSLGRPVGVVARLPQPRALLGPASPRRSRRRRAPRRSPAPSRPARRRRPRCRGIREQRRRLGQAELGSCCRRRPAARRAARCARRECPTGWSGSRCRPRPHRIGKLADAADDRLGHAVEPQRDSR
jgi:hypothetical protein